MKRLLIFLIVASACCIVNAADYNYLIFRQADGTETSLSAQNLKITFSGGNAVATTADGAVTTLSLSSLSSMYFSNSATNIGSTVSQSADEKATVYTITGVKVAEGISVGSLNSTLHQGTYIVKTNERTFKVVVK